MAGLLTYLIGPGRHNEHTDPHLVAGDDALMAWHCDDELNRDAALGIARHLDRPHRNLGVDVAGGHVWHCSLSIRAEEGVLNDDTWGSIARDFIAAMEFDDNEGTKAPCRWVAVRHGVSKRGNDHIHIAVNLVREDGTKANTYRDYRRAQDAARALERKYGLEELESLQAERATRGYHHAELQAQARVRARAKHERERATSHGGGTPWEALTKDDRNRLVAAQIPEVQPRVALAIKVRGFATASQSEAEFVRRCRGAGLIIRPRYAAGTTGVVRGYKVAERSRYGEQTTFYGGGALARDLSLPRLRDNQGWTRTPEAAAEAVAEWNAAMRGQRVVTPGREALEVDPQMLEDARGELDDLVRQVRAVPLDDRHTWTRVARQTSGVLAAWSNATEHTPGDLAQAAEVLSRSAQTYRKEPPAPTKAGRIRLAGTAMVLASAMKGGQGTVAHTAMVMNILRLTQAVYDAQRASGQARLARTLASDTRRQLQAIRDRLPPLDPPAQTHGTVAVKTKPGQQVSIEEADLTPEQQNALRLMRLSQAHSATKAVNPVPEKIEPTTPARTTPATKDPGIER